MFSTAMNWLLGKSDLEGTILQRLQKRNVVEAFRASEDETSDTEATHTKKPHCVEKRGIFVVNDIFF